MGNMKYFNTCKTAEECKSLYRKLAKMYHPDNTNGDDTIIKQINAEYVIVWERLKDIHFNAETGERFTSENKTTEKPEEFIEIIRNLSTLSGINVELCGRWLWITGNTYPVKTQLFTFGCKYSKSKKAWYWAKDINPLKYKHGKSMKAIRQQYGSQNIHLNPSPLLD